MARKNMDNFIDYMSSLWNTPAVDAAVNELDVVTPFEAQDYLRSALDKKQELQEQALQDAEQALLFQEYQLSNLTVISDSNSLSAYLSKNGIAIQKSGGLMSIQKVAKIINKTGDNGNIDFDETDYMDYNNRYVSIDAMRSNGDATDIAFFRIINNKTREAVFPNVDAYPQPGITKNKFKQFIVTQIQEPASERMQLIETSDEYQLLFFGEKPKVLSIAGVLKNTKDNPWNTNMVFAWSEYMRGTKLAEAGNIMMLYIDGQLYYGYPFNFNRSKIAGSDFIVSFNMSFIVRDEVSSLDVKSTVYDENENYNTLIAQAGL